MKRLMPLLPVSLLLLANVARAVDGQIKIAQTSTTTFPITISASGSYVLTTDLTVTSTTVNAITISADDVTLDLNGHTISGPGSGSGSGVRAYDQLHITVQNGAVRDFGWMGVSIDQTNYHAGGHIIRNICARNNVQGGIHVTSGLVVDCTAVNNGSSGISCVKGIVRSCVAHENDSLGMFIGVSTVTDCQVYSNAGHGIYVPGNTWAGSSLISNCTVCDNGSAEKGGYGIYLDTNVKTLVRGCVVSANYDGQINDAASNTVIDCSVWENAREE